MDHTPNLTPADRRIVIVGGPCSGKSTLAAQLGLPVYCGDPRSTVRAPQGGVTYLPEGLTWSAGSQHIVDHWLTMPAPWVIEGHVMARALRKHITQRGLPVPADRILVLPDPVAPVTPEQAAMTRAVRTVWREIAPELVDVTQVLRVPSGDVGQLDAVRELGRLAGGA